MKSHFLGWTEERGMGAADFKDGENVGAHCEKEWPECAGALHLKMCLGIKYLIERTCFF